MLEQTVLKQLNKAKRDGGEGGGEEIEREKQNKKTTGNSTNQAGVMR